jgi:prepilin-type N-terminal cleavage/methylation domain-containing protein
MIPASTNTNHRQGFTLLEVMIALAILSVSLFVLVSAQSSAVLMTSEGERDVVMTMLAEQKIAEVQMKLEREGWKDTDIEEAGNFEDFGLNGEFGDGVELKGAYDDYQWAYTIRRVDLQMGDMGGAMDAVTGAYGGQGGTPTSSDDMSSMVQDQMSSFISSDSLTDTLAPFIREVRVLVWYGEEPKDENGCENCVELTTHVINPTGQVFQEDQ